MKKIDFSIRWKKLNIMMIVALSIGLISLVGTTYAFYSSNASVENKMLTKGSEVFVQEVFNKDDLWLPGETKTKEVHFGNQSEMDQVIRFKLDVTWFDKDDNDITGSVPSSAYTINFDAGEMANWTDMTGTDGYFYYNKVLGKMTGTPLTPTLTGDVIKSVSFSSDLNNDVHNAGDIDYSEARCQIIVTMESQNVDAGVVLSDWGRTVVISGSNLTWS